MKAVYSHIMSFLFLVLESQIKSARYSFSEMRMIIDS